MEFLRLGSSIPGSYWGCCAFDYIQCFDASPDTPASIELVYGDSGQPILDYSLGDSSLFAGKTYEDIFWQRLRYGTMGKGDMPNHGFLAVLTSRQLRGPWLPILKKAGFEFIRTVDNSVYTGSDLQDNYASDEDEEYDEETGEYVEVVLEHPSSHPCYLFALFRNISASSIDDPYKAPQVWLDLPSVVPEVCTYIEDTEALAVSSKAAQLEAYKSLPPKKYYTEEELVAAKVPITLAGRRSEKPQQFKSCRDKVNKKVAKTAVPPPAPGWLKVPEPATL